ncbi:ephrin-B2 [Pimephales promelas]|nr:ephrin-B2 [Pimephales promelas]
MEGLDNQEGGVCKTKSMKIIMKVGQNPSDPISPKIPHQLPSPNTPPDTGGKDTKSNEVLDKQDASHHEDKGDGNKSSSVIGSEVALFACIASASVIVIIIIIMLVFLLLKYRRRHRKHSPQHATTLSLSTLATPKRAGGGATTTALSRATSSSHCGLLTASSAHITRKSAAITDTQFTSYRKCRRRAQRTSIIKCEHGHASFGRFNPSHTPR